MMNCAPALRQELQLRLDFFLVPRKPVSDRIFGVIMSASSKQTLD
jgi:hypothetical protein